MKPKTTSYLTRDDLRGYFLSGIKKPSEFRVGVEWEKIAVDKLTGGAIPYHGARGVKSILLGLVHKYHWIPVLSLKGEPIALKRGKSSLTLEPGGQIELSGQKALKIGGNAHELYAHLDEIRAVSEPLGIVWLGLGAQPFSTQKNIAWVPKDRYAVMMRVLKRRGSKTFSMMKETASVQVSLDFSSEADALQKLRLAMSLSPYITATFANSFLEGGRRSNFLSRRADIWHHTDPARTGILWKALEADFGLDDYVDYALHVPMFFIQRNSKWITVRGRNFKTFLQRGYGSYRANAEDWALHLTTIFTEARLKKYIEIRSIDCQTSSMGLAAATLLKTLFYHPTAFQRSSELLSSIPITDHMEIYYQAPRRALRSATRKIKALEIVNDLFQIAQKFTPKEEMVFLKPLEETVRTGLCPAELFIKKKGVSKNRQVLLRDLIGSYSL